MPMDDSWDEEDRPPPKAPTPKPPADERATRIERLLVERGIVSPVEAELFGPATELLENLRKAGRLGPDFLDRLRREAALREILDLIPGSGIPPEVPKDAEQLGRYLLAKRIGEGGMGEVWRAWDVPHHRWVAIKFLKGRTTDDLNRFLREANLAARLQHPNVIRVYEIVTDPHRPYLVMELIEGRSLDGARLEPRRAAEIVRDAARATQHAHDLGIIHRDLKPGNVMEATDGRTLVMDFGLARTTLAGGTLTMSGALLGTPSFMAPEQARGIAVDTRTDVYGLGVTLWSLVEGRPPFDGENPTAIAARVATERVPPLSTGGGLAQIVAKATEHEPADRYARAADLADDLDRFLATGSVLGRPVGRLTRAWRRARRRPFLAAALAAVLVAGSVFLSLELPAAMRTPAPPAVDAERPLAPRVQEARKYAAALAEYPRLRPLLEREELHKEAPAAILSEIETRRMDVQLVVLTADDGHPAARLLDGKPLEGGATETPWIQRELRGAEGSPRPYLALRGRLFAVATAPVLEGNRFLGVLLVGLEAKPEAEWTYFTEEGILAGTPRTSLAGRRAGDRFDADGWRVTIVALPSEQSPPPLAAHAASTEAEHRTRRNAWLRSGVAALVLACVTGVLGRLLLREAA